MLALVVSACLVDQPYSCMREVAAWSPPDLPGGCQTLTDARLPLWQQTNPEYFIQGTWCEPGRKSPAEASPIPATSILPADCLVSSRPQVIAWALRNPGQSYWQTCVAQNTN